MMMLEPLAQKSKLPIANLFALGDRMDIHQRIKQLRLHKAMTQEQLAYAVSIKEGLEKPLLRQTVQQWENGMSAPRHTRLAVVAQVLGVSVEELLGPPVTHAERVQQRHATVPLPIAGEIRGIEDGKLQVLQYDEPKGHVHFPITDPKAYTMRVRGDMTAPRFRSGELIVVSPASPPGPGMDVLVRCKDGGVLLAVLAWERDDEVHLMALNETYAATTLQRVDIESIELVAGHLMMLEPVPQH